MPFVGGRAPLPLDQLEAHARRLAAGHMHGKRRPAAELLARLDRNAARREQIYKKLSDRDSPIWPRRRPKMAA